MESFREKYNLEKRVDESKRVLEKYPDRIPIIVERSNKCNDIKDIDKNKFLVPKDLTCGQLYYIIRKRLSIGEEQALFFFCNNLLHNNSIIIQSIYDKYKDKDGFLYFVYSAENTFG